MAVTIFEKFGSGAGQESSGPGSRQVLAYIAFGTSDDKAIKTAIQNHAPPTYDGLIAESYTIDPIGPDLWDVAVSYVDPSRKQEAPITAGSYRHEFSTSGGNVHLTHGLAVRSYAPTGKTAPNYTGAINVRNNIVEGCDIISPMMRHTIRKRISRAVITESYINNLAYLTGKVNNAVFRGYAKGEVLFMGADGQQGTEIDPEVSFDFMISRNLSGLSYGAISNVIKYGHEFLWVDYEAQDDATASALIQKPRAVYCHQVYEFGDFNTLNI